MKFRLLLFLLGLFSMLILSSSLAINENTINDASKENILSDASKKIEAIMEEGRSQGDIVQRIRQVIDPDKELKRPQRIVGGNPAQPGEFPWQVSIQFRTELPPGVDLEDLHDRHKVKHGLQAEVRLPILIHFCGGTLINPLWVVTAAHCTLNRHTWELAVAAGTVDLADRTVPIYSVKKIIRHNYDIIKKVNDIALLKIWPPVTQNRQGSHTARPITLPSPGFRANGSCTVSGWGYTKPKGSIPTRLHATDVKVMPDATCQERIFTRHIYHSMLCAGGKEKDACTGDSGGPLVCRHGNKIYLSGVVSWGIGCATPSIPGVYTEVAYYTKWILQKVKANSKPEELKLLRSWLNHKWETE